MKVKSDFGGFFGAILLLIIYVPLILRFLLGQKYDFFDYLSENYEYSKIVMIAYAISSGIFWFWMLFDWGSRTFVKKQYKFFWLLIFFLSYVFGSTVYYFVVCKLRKGISIPKA